MRRFSQQENLPIDNQAEIISSDLKNHSATLREKISREEGEETLIKKYYAYEEQVRKGHLGKTSAYSMLFITHCREAVEYRYGQRLTLMGI